MEIKFEDETVYTKPSTALVFLDETGDESLNDPCFPFFGFGGCCILEKNYDRLIHYPWVKIKKEVFHIDNNKPFHAADIKISKEQEDQLETYFDKSFGRFASVIPKELINESNMTVEQIAFLSVHNRFLDIINTTGCSDIVLIYEHSRRILKKLNRFLPRVKITAKDKDGNDYSFPIKYGTLIKGAAMPGLELADLVIYTAGQAARDKHQGVIERHKDNSLFSYIFGCEQSQLSSFMYIQAIKVSMPAQVAMEHKEIDGCPAPN